jgi:hypothetical protein
MKNDAKIILDLCGGTGSWSKPYRDAGYTVHIITLPEYSVADWWLAGNGSLIRFRRNSPRKDGMSFLEVPVNEIYGIFAAPPCTQFSIARTRAKIPRDLQGGMATVESCLRLIWHVQSHQGGKLRFWALENPVGMLRRFLGRPQFSFKQWEYGDGRDKPTDIWGFFNEPRRLVKDRPVVMPPRWGNERVRDGLDRAAIRAMTPKGFADQFYRANQ